MVVLATAATVIASQAVISGAFSVTRQAVGLGFLPRLTIRHTSEREIGQVYVPAINWGIFVAVVALVVGFGIVHGARLGLRHRRHRHAGHRHDPVLLRRARAVAASRCGSCSPARALFLTVDLAFFSANLTKVLHGGWFPLAIALVVFVVLTTWQKGREIVTRNRTEEEGPLRAFVDELRDAGPAGLPGARHRRLPQRHARRRRRWRCAPTSSTTTRCTSSVVIISIETLKVPNVPRATRSSIDDLGYRDDGISHVTARLGFQDDIDVPRLAPRRPSARGLEGDCDVDAARRTSSRA